jgi:hypothetical protein
LLSGAPPRVCAGPPDAAAHPGRPQVARHHGLHPPQDVCARWPKRSLAPLPHDPAALPGHPLPHRICAGECFLGAGHGLAADHAVSGSQGTTSVGQTRCSMQTQSHILRVERQNPHACFVTRGCSLKNLMFPGLLVVSHMLLLRLAFSKVCIMLWDSGGSNKLASTEIAHFFDWTWLCCSVYSSFLWAVKVWIFQKTLLNPNCLAGCGSAVSGRGLAGVVRPNPGVWDARSDQVGENQTSIGFTQRFLLCSF